MAIADQLNAAQMLEKMEKLPKPWRYGMLGLVFAAVLVLYWFTFYGERSAQLAAIDKKLTGLETKINESRAVASNLEKFREKREELQVELKQALRRLPNSQEFPVLLTDITSLGKKSGLEFHSFKPGKETMRGFYAEVPIQIELVGRYHDVGVFFDRVANLDRIVNVSDLTFKIGKDTGDSPELVVTGTATTFRFVEERPAEKDAEAKAGGE